MTTNFEEICEKIRMGFKFHKIEFYHINEEINEAN